MAALPALAQDVINPLARNADADPRNLLPGSWYGANLENRSNCSATQNNGSHGTYAQYAVSFDRPNAIMGIDETAITTPTLRCSYVGTYNTDRFRPQWTGNYSCSDGKTGSFVMQKLLATPNEMSIRLAIKLNGRETCDVDSILGGSRF
ncbi:MAG TPA: hypothetical protein VF348_09500, partial [Usitatibacter sp.]